MARADNFLISAFNVSTSLILCLFYTLPVASRLAPLASAP
jgi:hypothetical protein